MTNSPRIILLASAHSYRARAFLEAAGRMGVEVIKGVDVPPAMIGLANGPLPLDIRDIERSARDIVAFAQEKSVQAIIPADDSATLLAARAAGLLGLPHNSPESVEATRSKYRMRQLFAEGGVPCPEFHRRSLGEDPRALAGSVHYPCVLKPLHLSGSRGVIRANDPEEFLQAHARLRRTLEESRSKEYLIEGFIPGFEVALEGVLTRGRLKLLALFDKPDPLDGPFFEETIYVTPSRLPEGTQAAILETAERAARALGLSEGPVHAELRVNDLGPWILEIAGRSIGGLCSQTLRFGTALSLEELILRQALGMEIESLQREGAASGVMMVPIPVSGLLREVGGCDEAAKVPGVESVEITAKPNHPIRALPEGDSYLGFIIARGRSAEDVERSLREAHGRLKIRIEPEIPVISGM